MAKKKKKKIVRYRRPLNLNIGMIIFAIIFVYMIFSVYTYMSRDKIKFYEVVEGSIVNDRDYTGIALRQESAKSTDRAGNINFYVREGKRASVGTRVYSIDETGSMASYLENNPDAEKQLTDDNISDLKRQLTAFSLSYNDNNYSSTYDIKYTLEASVLEYVNFNALDNADSVMAQMGVNFQQVKADQAGVISYAIDGYETLDASQISSAVFDRTSYSKTITKSNDLVGTGTPVYKVITSDKWSLIFPMEEADVTEYGQSTQLTVSFKGRDLTVSGAFSLITGTDGKPFGKIDLDKYMSQFASDRYIDFEIVSGKVEGLKIPVSAVVNKNFYLVPVEYLTKGGDSSEQGFLKEVYSEAGTSTVFVPTTLYFSTKDSYYIDMSDKSEIKAGDYIVKPNSTDRYQVGTSASLQGVYNINKGYTVFKQIEIDSSNNEYYTVKKGTKYGLSVFDHIVLDGSTVTEDELIYQ